MAGKILIIDDDRDITQIIRILLEGEGFETCTAYSGTQALASLDETVELIILDIMMDGMNGFEVCHRIRESSYVPILFLSAMSGDSEKVAALMAGGDDYLCKPFSAAELTARVDALFRRTGGDEELEADDEVVQPPFRLNTRNRTLEKNGQRVKLTQVEYSIMKVFMENPGKALSREEILDAVWGKDYFGELKIVDVNIRRLRIKLEDDAQNPVYITTVWGYGYKWGT